MITLRGTKLLLLLFQGVDEVVETDLGGGRIDKCQSISQPVSSVLKDVPMKPREAASFSGSFDLSAWCISPKETWNNMSAVKSETG